MAAAAAIASCAGTDLLAADPDMPPGVKGSSSVGRDIAILNASIWTLDPRQPRAQAALVRGGRIALVGSNAEVRQHSRGAPTFDAGNKTVVPGFVDTHTHFELACCYYAGLQLDVHSPPMVSLQQMFAALRERQSRTADGQWIVARGSFGFDSTVQEKRLPSRLELDAISDRHPIVVMAGLHRVAMNTLGFKKLGLWDPTAAAALRFRDGRPRVGTDVARDSEGTPTGSATEIFDLLPTLHSIEDKREAIRHQAVPHFSAKGLTSLATIPLQHDDLIVDQQLQVAGALPLRLRFYYTVPLVVSLNAVLEGELLPGAGDDMLRYGGVKVFPSGAGVDAAGKTTDDMKFTQDEFDDFVWRVHSAGQQLLMHEEGGLSLAWGLSAVEKAQQRRPLPLRHRMEHSYLLEDIEQIRRARRLGMRITTTPMQSRFAALYPIPRYATLIREGIEPAAVSDATGTVPEFSPLTAIASIVAPQSEGGSAPTGESPGIEDAIRMWTLWAARAQFEEADKGSIERGKLGDFAVLSDDLDRIHGGALFDTKVAATILGGKVVYQRPA